MLGVAIIVVGLAGCDLWETKERPKYSIKTVMYVAHGKEVNLADKVIKGNADADDQAQLLELYTALAANSPPRGDAESWHKKTTAITSAMHDVIDGKYAAEQDLRRALNCKACHEAHR